MRNAVIALLVVLVAGLVWWQGSGQPEPVVPEVVVEAPAVTPTAAAPAEQAEHGPAESGLVETPSVDEPVDFDARVEALTRRDSDGLKAELLPDGSTKIDLQGRYQQAPVARLNDDGEVEISEQ